MCPNTVGEKPGSTCQMGQCMYLHFAILEMKEVEKIEAYFENVIGSNRFSLDRCNHDAAESGRLDPPPGETCRSMLSY